METALVLVLVAMARQWEILGKDYEWTEIRRHHLTGFVFPGNARLSSDNDALVWDARA